MEPLKAARFISFSISLTLLACFRPWAGFTLQTTWASPSPPLIQIHITLLGQPCLLQGPFDESTLKTIHSIGPAQLYPNISLPEPAESKMQIQKALQKIRSTSNLPMALEDYAKKITKRLEAQASFFDALIAFNKLSLANSNNPNIHADLNPLLKMGRRYLNDKEFRNFEAHFKKFALTGPRLAQHRRDFLEQLYDIFMGGIEPDPEEFFHRALLKEGTHYKCTFEDQGEES